MFVVEGSKYEKPTLPEDSDLEGQGKLRCLLASRRLLLIQNHDNGRTFQYGPMIFCDSNFVSYCRTFYEGLSLGSLEGAFREVVRRVLPFASSLDALPYLLENFENLDRPQLRETVRAFTAFKLTPPESFAQHGRFDGSGSGLDLDREVDDQIAIMHGGEFKLLHAWMRQHYLWARIVLIEAALIVFEKRGQSVENKFYTLLEFLHLRLARMPIFELYIALRYFTRTTNERFFGHMDPNVSNLNDKLSAMAWDLAHWRSLFEWLLIRSGNPAWTPFPVPYILSFDSRFIELIESYKLQGLLYSDRNRRNEYLFSRPLTKSLSDLLHGKCGKFFDADALNDRLQRHKLDGNNFDQWLEPVEVELTNALAAKLSSL